MTTIVGIKTNTGPIDAVVLASDTQMAIYDIEGKLIEKKPFYKIIGGDFWALAHSGYITDELRSFYNRLTKPHTFKNFTGEDVKNIIIEANKKKKFDMVTELNAEYYKELYEESSIEEEEDFFGKMHEFLFAVNQPAIALYHIDPYGNLHTPNKDEPCLALGTGAKKAKNYIREKLEGLKYDAANIDLRTAHNLCIEALLIPQLGKKAIDIHTGGTPYIAYVRKEGVFFFGENEPDAILDFLMSRYGIGLQRELDRK